MAHTPQVNSRPAFRLTPWASTGQAAQELGLSQASLYRRTQAPHWIEGRHYRWIFKGRRKVLQFHVAESGSLIRRHGW
jgi:hypothetical protein